MKQIIKLTETELNRMIQESIQKSLNEGSVFSHQNDEWGNDYFTDAKTLVHGMYKMLDAMEDEGNSNDYQSSIYFYRQFVDRYNQLGQIIPIIKKYIKEPSVNV